MIAEQDKVEQPREHGSDRVGMALGEQFLDDHLPYLLARATHTVRKAFHEELRAHEVSEPMWLVLASLSDGSAATVSHLGEIAMQQQPTMTKLLDQMEGEALVVRSRDSRDRRSVRIHLTEAGEAKAQRLVQAAVQYEALLTKLYLGGELAATKEALRRLTVGPHPTPRR
jgi:MarR family transcriptional regulator, organic hydroperoxide resistance regulator